MVAQVARGYYFIAAVTLLSGGVCADGPPNVVLVITDDQGYGDVGAHGNSMIRTPNLDQLYAQSVRLTDFHVDPTCSPTRAALMSGRYSTRTGVWHTIMGRSLMRTEEVTIAEMFAANGYRTGLFGKWHLGENFPLRPQDQGFHEALYHGGGGVGQGPDYWDNDYFDDTYFRNGVPESFEGYCTDVWFQEALKFIQAHQDRPFFVYISTNAPHGPLHVSEQYSRPYAEQGVEEAMAKFYGMITNIDENMGRLMALLDERRLTENTILMFMTDNGTANGVLNRNTDRSWKGFNAGMRGRKGSEYDGGHRVPFYIRWPKGGLAGGRDVDSLAAHIDVLPTLEHLCGLKKPTGPELDGQSLAERLRGNSTEPSERTLLVHSQRIHDPEKWRKCAVMTERWRLVNRTELYNVQQDPGQSNNVAAEHPDMVERLRAAYEDWWSSLSPAFDRDVHIGLGSSAEQRTQLHPHDWLVDDQASSAWHQNHVRRGVMFNGPWMVDVQAEGMYRIELRRWPSHVDQAIEATKARLQVADVDVSQDVAPDSRQAVFHVPLPAGQTRLQTWLTRPDGKSRGAYFVYVEPE